MGSTKDSIDTLVAFGPRPFQYPDHQGHPGQYAQNPVHPMPQRKDFAVCWRGPEGRSHTDYKVSDLVDYRPLIIAVWMRKGGVGKSNMVYMLGHALAKLGKRTLMVDCDSQQDLTELCFRKEAEDNGSDDIEKYLTTKLPASPLTRQACEGRGETEGRSIADLANAVRYPLKMDASNPVRPSGGHATNCNLMVPYPFAVGTAARVRNLYLVQGGSRFEEMETKLDQEFALQLSPNRNAPGALFHAIWNAGISVAGGGAEIILLDCSPALGRTNQTLVCHSDYYICPSHIDKLCEKNLLGIPKSMEKWYQDFQSNGPGGHPLSGIRQITRGQTTRDGSVEAELPLPEIEPKFLGIIINKYDVKEKAKLGKRNSEGELVLIPEKLKSVTREQMAKRLLNAATGVAQKMSMAPKTVEDNGFAAHEELFDRSSTGHVRGSLYCPQPYLLASIRKATPLFEAAIARCGKPITMLTEEDFPQVRDFLAGRDDEEDIAHYRRIFEDLAKFITELPQPPKYNFGYNPATNTQLQGYEAGIWANNT